MSDGLLTASNFKLPMNSSRSHWFTGSKEIQGNFQNVCELKIEILGLVCFGDEYSDAHDTFESVTGKGEYQHCDLSTQTFHACVGAGGYGLRKCTRDYPAIPDW